MSNPTSTLKTHLRYITVLLGVLQITVGCCIGFIPPTAVQWYRGIVMAHIEFTVNGIMMIVLGLLVREIALGAPALKVWFVALQIGTWTNGGAGVVAAFIGTSSTLMSTTNAKFPPPNGDNSALVTGLLQLCGITVMLTLALTLYGLWRGRPWKVSHDA